jgi:hypothetical protein
MRLWRLVADVETVTMCGHARWDLTLVCGHGVDRPVRYREDYDTVTGEALRVPLPPPRKVHCPACETQRKTR